MATLLEQLKKVTTVVADTGDINSIQKFKPTDSTTNPSLIAAASAMPEYSQIVDDVLKESRDAAGDKATDEEVAAAAFKSLAVAFGKKILKIVPGRVSTEVDARLSYDKEKTLEQARDIIAQYDKAGIGRERVLVKIASTWEGIKAAEVLEQEGIHCNLTLLFGLHQAIACADAKVTLVSPFVGRILDWYKKDTGKDYVGADDPGVQSVTKIYNYYKKFGYKTQVMGASFRNIGEITELAGSDLLTIAPQTPRRTRLQGRRPSFETRCFKGRLHGHREAHHRQGNLREDARRRSHGPRQAERGYRGLLRRPCGP